MQESKFIKQASQGFAVVNDANYTCDEKDDLVVLTVITADRTLTLPTAAECFDGKTLTIKDESGNLSSGLREWTIATPGTEKIDGADTVVLAVAYDGLGVRWRAGQWWKC